MAEKPLAEIHRETLLSVLDVVEELCLGLAHGQTPEPDWADMVKSVFDQHRLDLREA
jgi:hypothetical protein